MIQIKDAACEIFDNTDNISINNDIVTVEYTAANWGEDLPEDRPALLKVVIKPDYSLTLSFINDVDSHYKVRSDFDVKRLLEAIKVYYIDCDDLRWASHYLATALID